MSYLNLLLLFLIAVYLLQGFHKGFLISLGNTIGMGISWVIGFLFSPLLSQTIAKGSFYKFILIFTEGSSHIADQVDGHLSVANLSAPQITQIVSDAHMPQPFSRLVEQNMHNLSFADTYSTVNDYFNYTVTNAVVNIISFLIIYCIARIIIALLINAVNFSSPLPVLKKFDGLIGGGVGAFRGFLGMYALCMLIPIVLISAPANITLFSEIVDGSSVATFFYESNFLLNFISGVI